MTLYYVHLKRTYQSLCSIIRCQGEGIGEHSYLHHKRDQMSCDRLPPKQAFLIYVMSYTHKPKDRQKQGPEEWWKRWQNTICQVCHDKTWTYHRGVQTLEGNNNNTWKSVTLRGRSKQHGRPVGWPAGCNVCWVPGWAGLRHIWRSCKVHNLFCVGCLQGQRLSAGHYWRKSKSAVKSDHLGTRLAPAPWTNNTQGIP